MSLTAKQERFAQLIAAGASSSESACYREAYDASGMTDKQVWEESSKLAHHHKVAPRIQELQAIQQKAVAERIAWDAERFVDEAETQLRIARTGGYRSVASGNGALELIGRATGILSDKPKEPQLSIKRVIIVVAKDEGVDDDEVVEASYEVLPRMLGTEEGESD